MLKELSKEELKKIDGGAHMSWDFPSHNNNGGITNFGKTNNYISATYPGGSSYIATA